MLTKLSWTIPSSEASVQTSSAFFNAPVRNVSVEHMPSSQVTTAFQMLNRGVTDFYQPHLDELQYFVNCINDDEAPSPSGEDGLRDLEAISKAYKNTINLE